MESDLKAAVMQLLSEVFKERFDKDTNLYSHIRSLIELVWADGYGLGMKEAQLQEKLPVLSEEHKDDMEFAKQLIDNWP